MTNVLFSFSVITMATTTTYLIIYIKTLNCIKKLSIFYVLSLTLCLLLVSSTTPVPNVLPLTYVTELTNSIESGT